jgi:hypothetical protein
LQAQSRSTSLGCQADDPIVLKPADLPMRRTADNRMGCVRCAFLGQVLDPFTKCVPIG